MTGSRDQPLDCCTQLRLVRVGSRGSQRDHAAPPVLVATEQRQLEDKEIERVRRPDARPSEVAQLVLAPRPARARIVATSADVGGRTGNQLAQVLEDRRLRVKLVVL
jgi:hypothetical protein